MIKRFQLTGGSLILDESEDCPIQVYINPDANERNALRTTLNLDEHTLSSTLDPDEVSRIELHPDHMLLIWKQPANYSGTEMFSFEVSSMGLLLFQEKLVIVAVNDVQFSGIGTRQMPKLCSPLNVMLGMLFTTIHHYLAHLKAIKLIARDLQQKINASMENKHLIQMFNLSESLVYYINAINTNGVVLARLRAHAEKAGFPSEVIAFIDDLVIENSQCYKQAEIYSTIFSGLMDARGNLVNNNMNILLKKLTIINVVFLPLNLIASIGGMSEFSTMTHNIDWRISYSLFCVAMIFFGWLTAVILKRVNFEKSASK